MLQNRMSQFFIKYDWRKIALLIVLLMVLCMLMLMVMNPAAEDSNAGHATSANHSSGKSLAELSVGATMDLPNNDASMGATIVLPQQTLVPTSALAVGPSITPLASALGGTDNTNQPGIGATVAVPTRTAVGLATLIPARPTATIPEGATVALPTLTASPIPSATAIPSTTPLPSITPIPAATATARPTLISTASPRVTASPLPTAEPVFTPQPATATVLLFAATPTFGTLPGNTRTLILPTASATRIVIVPTATPSVLAGTPNATALLPETIPPATSVVFIPFGDLAITTPQEGAQLPLGTLLVSGTGPAGKTVELLNGDRVIGTAVVQRDRSWQLPLNIPDPESLSLLVRLQGSDKIEHRPVRITVGAVVVQSCTDLAVGCDAWVTRNGQLALRMRSGPGMDQDIAALLPVGTQVKLLEAPQIANGWRWWRVRTIGGREGWVAGEQLVIRPD